MNKDWENEKKFLASLMNCGYPNIKRAARKNFNRMIKVEKRNIKDNEKACLRVLNSDLPEHEKQFLLDCIEKNDIFGSPDLQGERR